jgi:hypothetical protein
MARAQDGTNPFDNPGKPADHKSTQAKAKSDDSHRKHWWSPPHWFHKKHDNAARTGQTGNNPDSKSGAVATATTKNSETRTAATTNNAGKPADKKVVAAANVPKTSSTNKPVTGARPTSTAVTRTATAGTGTPGNTQIKKTNATATGKSKKTVRHDCTPEHAKKSGCEVGKGSSQKGTAGRS